MTRDEHATREIDFSKRYNRHDPNRGPFLHPSSYHKWEEAVMLVVLGLLGGFGLGLAYAMLVLTFTDKI